MLGFIRQMRRQLLEKRNYGQYGLYAISEVILIVAGILAALWIDNWNEQRKEAEREQFYLAGLQEEFEQSRGKLQILIDVNRETFNKARAIAEAIGRPDSTLTENELATLLFQAFSDDFAYNPNNSVLQELLGAGRLEILKNTELRKRLAAWFPRIERIRQQEASLREQRYRVLDLSRGGMGSIRSVFEQTGLASGLMQLSPSIDPGSNLSLLESRSFENNVLIFILTGIYTEQMHYQPLLAEIDSILSLIGPELD